jgi:hypothetical protein
VVAYQSVNKSGTDPCGQVDFAALADDVPVPLCVHFGVEHHPQEIGGLNVEQDSALTDGERERNGPPLCCRRRANKEERGFAVDVVNISDSLARQRDISFVAPVGITDSTALARILPNGGGPATG